MTRSAGALGGIPFPNAPGAHSVSNKVASAKTYDLNDLQLIPFCASPVRGNVDSQVKATRPAAIGRVTRALKPPCERLRRTTSPP